MNLFYINKTFEVTFHNHIKSSLRLSRQQNQSTDYFCCLFPKFCVLLLRGKGEEGIGGQDRGMVEKFRYSHGFFTDLKQIGNVPLLPLGKTFPNLCASLRGSERWTRRTLFSYFI